ncbi:MAG: hypothetical protein FJ280_25290 [Planctomycetes bacterium]|nr:hypothetical protein [Planctomycetota bacterium]
MSIDSRFRYPCPRCGADLLPRQYCLRCFGTTGEKHYPITGQSLMSDAESNRVGRLLALMLGIPIMIIILFVLLGS